MLSDLPVFLSSVTRSVECRVGEGRYYIPGCSCVHPETTVDVRHPFLLLEQLPLPLPFPLGVVMLSCRSSVPSTSRRRLARYSSSSRTSRSTGQKRRRRHTGSQRASRPNAWPRSSTSSGETSIRYDVTAQRAMEYLLCSISIAGQTYSAYSPPDSLLTSWGAEGGGGVLGSVL